jgi:predicted phage tail protein
LNLFELFVKIGVDDQASGKLKELGGKLGNGLKTAAKIGTAAVATAAAGIAALTTAAVNNYAEYEQLVGGVETLYGSAYKSVEEYAEGVGISLKEAQATFEQYQNRQQDVLDNAKNAYKTAGMSANEYMNTVNGFAASLTSSLGEYEWQAANYADMIVSDMADNANKMGTNMEMIQNAYAGFAKQNYTIKFIYSPAA